jgi:hypothetical protein
MYINLSDRTLTVINGQNQFSFRQPIDQSKAVLEIVNGKQTVTYSMEELELRALYEVLKRRFA